VTYLRFQVAVAAMNAAQATAERLGVAFDHRGANVYRVDGPKAAAFAAAMIAMFGAERVTVPGGDA
jgi:hypothetical protein